VKAQSDKKILNHALQAYKSLKIVDIFPVTMYNFGDVKQLINSAGI
jgi:hypothetical protein